MAAAKRHRHVVEVVEEEKPVVDAVEHTHIHAHPLAEDKPAEILQPQVTPDVQLPSTDMGLLGVNIEQSSGGGGLGKMMWLVVAIVAAGVVTGAWLVWQLNQDKQQLADGDILPTPSVQVETTTPSPEPSPTPEVKLAEFKVRVLNGSGIKGEAGRIAALLEKAGFEDVTTGNATKFDYSDIEVSYKSTAKLVAKTVEEVLKDFTVSESDELATSSAFDIVVTVGEKSE